MGNGRRGMTGRHLSQENPRKMFCWRVRVYTITSNNNETSSPPLPCTLIFPRVLHEYICVRSHTYTYYIMYILLLTKLLSFNNSIELDKLKVHLKSRWSHSIYHVLYLHKMSRVEGFKILATPWIVHQKYPKLKLAHCVIITKLIMKNWKTRFC